MNIKLELVIHKHIVYLNFWDAIHGNDVCVNIDQEGNFFIADKKITINEWLNMLRKAIHETRK